MATSKKENLKTEDLLQNAVNKLAIILKIIFEDNQDIFLKKPEEVSVKGLNNLSGSFISLSTLFQEVIEEWSEATPEGFDVFRRLEELEDQLDIQVSEADKLDIEQKRKITSRMNRINDGLESLERISVYLKYYEDLCRQKGLTNDANLSELFRVFGIEEFIKILRIEAKKNRKQIERDNLYNNMYNQARLNTKTLKIAYTALGISILSVILAVLGLLLR
jgi:hypothetical protein